jgi:hypothetical protein
VVVVVVVVSLEVEPKVIGAGVAVGRKGPVATPLELVPAALLLKVAPNGVTVEVFRTVTTEFWPPIKFPMLMLDVSE